MHLYIITVIFGFGLTKAGVSTQLRTVKIQTNNMELYPL